MTIEKLMENNALVNKILNTFVVGYKDTENECIKLMIDICDDFKCKVDRKKALELLNQIRVVEKETEQHCKGALSYTNYLTVKN